MGRPCLCCGCEKCEKCVSSSSFKNFEYAILICNVNSAKDDEFDLYLNNVLLGRVSELGEDTCKGKWFVTNGNIDIIQKIKNSKNNKCNSSDFSPPVCCSDNTTSIAVIDSKKNVFFDETFNVFLENKKNNNNGNYGYIGIWRVKGNSVCQIANGIYQGESGQDIYSSLSSNQKICCCNKNFSKLIFEISGAYQGEAYHPSLALNCSPSFGNLQGEIVKVLNQPPFQRVPPCPKVNIDGTYILNTSLNPNLECEQTTIDRISTQGVSINSFILQIKYCPGFTPSVGPGFNECYKKLCINNPYVFYLDQGYRITGQSLFCGGQFFSRPVLSKLDEIKIKVTGVED